MHRFKLFVIATLASAPLACGRPSLAAPASGRVFGDSIGINVKFSQGQPMSELPLVKDLGVRWVRDGAGWAEMEPTPGQYADWPADFEQRLRYYKANHIGVLFGLWYDNPAAYPNTAENPRHSFDSAAFGRYAAAMARKLKASGVRFVLEIWNEPHNFGLAKAFGGGWNAKPPSPWVDHYVEMVHEAVKQVKAADPTVKLLDCDDMYIIHYWYMEKGLPRDLDGFAFHPYCGSSCAGPEMAPIDQNTEWTRPFTLVDADRSFTSAVRRMRDQGRTKLGRAPALWATEWGWAIGQDTPYGKASEELVGDYIPRAFITAADAGVETTLWFSMKDSVDGPMGLIQNDGTKRKSYDAFRTMAAELGRLRLAGHLSGADHPSSGMQVYRFTGGGEEILVAWNIDGDEPVLVSGLQAGAKVVDTFGQPAKTSPAPGGLRVTLGHGPVYIHGAAKARIAPARSPNPAAPVYLFP